MAWASAGAWNRPRSGGWQSGAVSPRVFAFDFLANTALPAAISLSRATTGTRFNSSGVWVSEAINAARFDYTFNGTIWVPAGLRSEEQRTNNVLQSRTLSGGGWTNDGTSNTANATTSPDGTTNAVKLVEAATTAEHRIYQFITITGSAVSAVSLFAKKAERNWVAIRSNSAMAVANFNVNTGVVGTTGGASFISASITDVGSGWFRCTMRMTTLGTGIETPTTNLGNADTGTGGSYSYAGDGTSGLYLWDYDWEVGVGPTSDILTTTGAVTRSADLLSSNAPLTGYLAAGPSILEATDLATGTTSRTAYAAGAFTWPQNQLYRLLAVYQPGTNTSGYLTVGGPY